MSPRSSSLRAPGSLAIGLSTLLFACDADDPEPQDSPNAGVEHGRYAIVANLENSSFLSTVDLADATHSNARAQELALYPHVFAHENTLFVAQRHHADTLLRFDLDAAGDWVRTGELVLPANGRPTDVLIESPTRGFVSLSEAGLVVAFDPATMTALGQVELGAYAYEDGSPDPGPMMLRDNDLFVALMQTQVPSIGHPLVSAVALDRTTLAPIAELRRDDTPLSYAGSEGEHDSWFLDDDGALYLYCAGSWGFVEGQSHGFVRILPGAYEFDPSYLFDVGATVLPVEGGRVMHLTHLTHIGNGRGYAAASIAALNSNPPDFVNDRPYQVVSFDVQTQAITTTPLPLSNGLSSELLFHQDRLWAWLGAAAGSGLYRFDPATGIADQAPFIPAEGFVSVMRPLL